MIEIKTAIYCFKYCLNARATAVSPSTFGVSFFVIFWGFSYLLLVCNNTINKNVRALPLPCLMYKHRQKLCLDQLGHLKFLLLLSFIINSTPLLFGYQCDRYQLHPASVVVQLFLYALLYRQYQVVYST